MAPEPSTDSPAFRELASSPAPLSIAEASRAVTTLLSERLGVPTALLSRAGGVWRFQAEAWPTGPATAPPWRDAADPLAAVLRDAEGHPRWTGIAVGDSRRDPSWMLLLPGTPETWEASPVVRQFVPDIGAWLEHVAERETTDEWKRVAQRYHRFCRRLTKAQTAEELYGLILGSLAAQVRARVGALAVYSDADRSLSIAKTVGYPQELVDHVRIAPGEGVIGSIFSTGRPALVSDRDQARRLRYRSCSYLAVPLTGQTGVLGVAAFTDRLDGGPFSTDDLAALRLFADPAGLALTMQKLRQAADEVTHLASIDSLTGLFNRRYFDTRLEAELQRARRHNEPLTLLMVDIDNFKAINDDYGHVVGDRLLRCVADRLRRGVRIFDVCARYGGDEFAILMPSSNVDTAMLVAQRIRTSVRGHCAHTEAVITVSIGIAHSDGREQDVLSAADRALIAAKRAGKDVVKTA